MAVNLSKSDYQINTNEVTSYIFELQFGDQTKDVNANKILRNINFVIACNIWLFIHDENDEDNQWNMILTLNDNEKHIASTHLTQSSHQFKATKYKISNNSVIKTISRIPKALTIGVQTCINQTTSSAECILVGSMLIIISNVHVTKQAIKSKNIKCMAASTCLIPLWACVSITGGALGGACSIAAVPLQTVGTAGMYVYNGTKTDDVISWKQITEIIPSFKQLITWISNMHTEQTLISFKENHSFEKRMRESTRILNKYPNRIPVICEPGGAIYDELMWDKTQQELKRIKIKYLVPSDLTIGQMIYVLRKKIQFSPERAIFVFVNNTLPSTAALISEVYNRHKDMDGFLYITYETENCYGTF